jgi:DNA excision repair protein ERCC-1
MSSNSELSVNNFLRGHTILHRLRHVKLIYSDIRGDFSPAPHMSIFHLSLRHVAAQPQYMTNLAINDVKDAVNKTVLICFIDISDIFFIEEINKFCCLNNISLILAWDNEELCRYVETIAVFFKEIEIADSTNLDFLVSISSALSEICCLNKQDVSTFINIFVNLANLTNMPFDGFAGIPGIGIKKAHLLGSLFQKPFVIKKK